MHLLSPLIRTISSSYRLGKLRFAKTFQLITYRSEHQTLLDHPMHCYLGQKLKVPNFRFNFDLRLRYAFFQKLSLLFFHYSHFSILGTAITYKILILCIAIFRKVEVTSSNWKFEFQSTLPLKIHYFFKNLRKLRYKKSP